MKINITSFKRFKQFSFFFNLVISVLFLNLIVSCSHSFLKFDKSEQLKRLDEFDSQVEIKALVEDKKTADPTAVSEDKKNVPSKDQVSAETSISQDTNHHKTSSNGQKKKSKNKLSATNVMSNSNSNSNSNSKKQNTKHKNKTNEISQKNIKTDSKKIKDSQNTNPDHKMSAVIHIPDIEGQNGFNGRRPLIDPYRVGEKVVHSVKYFRIEAGQLTMEVKPFADVNGRKSYTFVTELKSNPAFTKLYSVDDSAITHLDFDTLVPSVFSLHIKESGQLKESRWYYNATNNKAQYWEKKYTEKNGTEERKQEWDVSDYSQNVFSAIFYMRVFPWTVGGVNQFRVIDDGQTKIFKGIALRKETIKTEAGTFNTIVVKPDIQARGAFKPIGDIYMWLTDDDRKLVVKIESEIKIGTIKTEVISLIPGS